MKKIILLLAILSQTMFAQTEQMIVHTISQGIINFDIEVVDKIEFKNDSMSHSIVIHSSNGQNEYDFEDLKKITFSPYGLLSKKIYIAREEQGIDSIDLNNIKDIVINPATSVSNRYEIHNSIVIAEPYPLPAEDNVNLLIHNNVKTNVNITVYNIHGKLIKTLYNGTMNIAEYNIQWDGTDKNNKTTVSGVYFFHIITNDNVTIKKIIIK